MSWLDSLEALRSRDFSKATEAERADAAREVINLCSYACAGLAVVPLPFSDGLLMLPIQSAMVMSVGNIYGRSVAKAEAKTLLLELSALAGASFVARQGIKAILPVFGAVLTLPAAYAANWAMGRVAMEYFKDPELSAKDLKAVYERARKEGAALFSLEGLAGFRKANGEGDSPSARRGRRASASKRAPAQKKARRKKPTVNG
jgi:uncharacterized protein (DUF697 family)